MGGTLHLPFWIFPGDLVLFTPVAIFSTDAYMWIVRQAAKGGLLEWQRVHPTNLGEVQIVFGRQIALNRLFQADYHTFDIPTNQRSAPGATVIHPFASWEADAIACVKAMGGKVDASRGRMMVRLSRKVSP